MMQAMKSPSITGQTFGKLTALYEVAPVPIKSGTRNAKMSRVWICRCECGNEKPVQGRHLKAKVRAITSCGCARGFKDLTGRRFGKWAVIERRGNDAVRSALWLCRCDCGTERLRSSRDLRVDKSRSCGCSKLTRGGDSESPEYAAWGAMIKRCCNPNVSNYADYGGRGILVCDEWRASYEMFLGHVGRRPSSEYSIGRIDNDGNYEPGNVRWETREQQNNNSRHNVNLTLGGETMTAAQWERRMGLSKGLIVQRIRTGMTIERAITKPMSKHSDKFLKKHDRAMA